MEKKGGASACQNDSRSRGTERAVGIEPALWGQAAPAIVGLVAMAYFLYTQTCSY